MAEVGRRTLDIRWVKKPRYRQFIVIGSLLFSVNVVLVHVLVNSTSNPSLEEEDPSGRGRYHTEAGAASEDDDNAIHSDTQFENERRRHIAVEKELLRRRKAPLISPKLNKLSSPTVAPSLNLAELDFVPECNVTSREAVSAVTRARTQDCKRLIISVFCQAKSNQLYPMSLPSSCPASGVKFGTELGCYQDSKSLRLLSGYFVNLEQANSPLNCSNLCLQSGFPYAAVEYWTECFCGAESPPLSARLPAASCNMKCPFDSNLVCGGYLTANVYQTGILKFSPQVAKTQIEKNVAAVRICYLLTLSGRALRQVKRLIRALYHPHHYFYIHVDARQDYLFRELVYLEYTLPNVKLMRKRHGTMWAGSSLLQMLLAAMKDVSDLPWKWDFVLNLSESDFPVKTNEKLVEFLTANSGRNFVKSTGRDIQRFIQKQGLDKTFVECDGHMWRVGDRRLPTGIQMDGGSDWLALSRPFVNYVTSEQKDDLLLGLDQVYKYTLLPAESYFHTVLRNSPFCDTYVDNNLHLTNWKRHLGCKCQYKHIVDWCGCSPNDFTLDDWSRITGSAGNHIFFARKFEAIINQGVINKLEDWLFATDHKMTINVLSYWQSIYHHQDLSPSRDGVVLTLSSSLSRVAAAQLTQSNSRPLSVNEDDVIELSSYHHDDVFQGIIVRYRTKAINDGSDFQIESWFKLKNYFTLLNNKNGKFIQNVYVTTEFDVKEQTTRAVHGALGTVGDLSLVYVVAADEPVNVTALVVDPAGLLAQVIDIHISDKLLGKPHIGSSRVVLPTPLLPGVWQLRVYHGGFHVAHNKFLVLPLPAFSAHHLQKGNDRSASLYKIAADRSHWASALKGDEDLRSAAFSNARRSGHSLESWIDSLSREFYTLVESCHIEAPSLRLEPCVETVWSTHAPDPKATISSFDPSSGKIR